MKGRKSGTKEAGSIPVSIAIGVLASGILSIVLSMVISAFVLNGTFEDNTIEYMSMGTLLVAAFTGTMLAGKKAAGKYGVVCLAVSLLFGFLLVGCNIIFFDGVFNGFLLKLLMILLGCGLSCVLLMKPAGRGRRKRYHR